MTDETINTIINDLKDKGVLELRSMASGRVPKPNLLKKDNLIVELAAALMLESQDEQEMTVASGEHLQDFAIEPADPEMTPGFYDHEDLHKPVAPEMLDPEDVIIDNPHVYLRWDPETRLIRALRDGEIAHPDLVALCENIPAGNQYDKIAGYLAQRCRDMGYNVRDDWWWELECQRLEN